MHALSIPTWMIHISSVIEWIAAIWLIWQYAEVSGNPAWKPFALAMLPALVSAMCACTWHFFDNAPSLEWLVTLQAAMTVVGNTTLCAAAGWLWYRDRQRKLNGMDGIGIASGADSIESDHTTVPNLTISPASSVSSTTAPESQP